ncbi:hypothetical protein GE061_010687 [Apolygus lucorum]|uniref:Protein sleepless n=1 Tax=Apolygus lucorum TaxID=248454 RepID=A0A6A4II55_APOLU|nr:hypothetical protein GE061_010687 [Apolygus lucorum]
MKSLAAVSLISLLSLLATAEGLKCHSCSGDRCGDPFSSSGEFETNCTPELAQRSLNTLKSAASKVSSALETLGFGTGAPVDINAKMICVKLKIKNGDKNLVTRSCGAQTGETDVCSTVKGENIECSTCDTDLCNGATAAHLSIALMSVTALLLASYSR